MNNQKPFAEIIQSSLDSWQAQSWQWNVFPRFGSLIIIQTPKERFFGIVHEICTGSMDPTRYPFPYKKTEEELLRDHPQIFEFLKTSFFCIPVGYAQGNKLHYRLPQEPPKIHAFVTQATQENYREFFGTVGYAHTLFNFAQQIKHFDELVLALLQIATQQKAMNDDTLSNFMELYSFYIGNDYRRLKIFLQRLQQEKTD